MIEKQLLRAISNISKESKSGDTIIVNKTIMYDILSRLSIRDSIELLRSYGATRPDFVKGIDGEWAKEVRKIIGISQEELAKRCGVKQCDVSYLENEKVARIEGKQQRKERIASELNVLFDEFLKRAA